LPVELSRGELSEIQSNEDNFISEAQHKFTQQSVSAYRKRNNEEKNKKNPWVSSSNSISKLTSAGRRRLSNEETNEENGEPFQKVSKEKNF
jgi:ABC-type oligopeptide transport system ATPase subunit